MRSALVFCLAAGCSFTGSPGGESEPTPDAAMSPDAISLIDAEAGCIGWPQQPVHFDPCMLGPPDPTPEFEGGTSVLDTDSGELTTPTGTLNLNLQGVPQADGPEIAVLYVEAFEVSVGTTLRAVGSRPLLVASESTIAIAGTIDVSSRRVESGSPAGASFSTHCLGVRDADGANGGGGGGGLATAGGAGGDGNTPDGAGDPGGQVNLGARLLPGCSGGIGRDAGNNASAMSAGGIGGGVVQLTARSTIEIAPGSMIAAGGMGGGASANNATGGGGGGSGGFIGLDAMTVNVTSNAFLLIHGGGGGEGTGANNPGDPGDDAGRTPAVAVGGTGQSNSGGDGGDGAFEESVAEGGIVGTNGGGGGGGGLGILVCRGCP